MRDSQRWKRRQILRFLSSFVFIVWTAGCTMLPKEEAKHDREASIREYQRMTTQLRGLPLKHEVAIQKETKAQLKVSMEKDLEKPDNKAALTEADFLLRQFRILKKDELLKDLLLRFMEEGAAAYYDHEERRLVYLEEKTSTNEHAAVNFQGMERFVYVHEFCHAIEDSHYGLTKRTKDVQSDFDRSQALTSFVEGNAVLVGIDSIVDGFPMNTATPFGAWASVSLMQGADMEDMAEPFEWCPSFLSGAMIRPYLDGMAFCNRIRRDTGWQGIDQAYLSRPPQTTADILYPERRYLKGFLPASFHPDPAFFKDASAGVTTNSLGVMGIALLLGGETISTAYDYGFLKGWLGDQVYVLKGAREKQQRVWLSYWERPGFARAFCSEMEDFLKKTFGDGSWSVQRDGRLVAIAWSDEASEQGLCETLAAAALKTRVDVDSPSWLGSWLNDLPWPLRFPVYAGHSTGVDLLGGYVMDADVGPSFYRLNVLSSLVLNMEENPDRHHFSTCFGLMRHVKDLRSDFTYWRIPVLASWLRCGHDQNERYEWSLLWGILADGTEKRVRFLFVPVWRHH